MKKEKIEFNVIIYDVNKNKFVPYDIMPILIKAYKDKKKDKPVTFDEFRKFIIGVSLYRWAYKCECEIILKDWPNGITESKIDINMQVLMNIDLITKVLMQFLNV